LKQRYIYVRRPYTTRTDANGGAPHVTYGPPTCFVSGGEYSSNSYPGGGTQVLLVVGPLAPTDSQILGRFLKCYPERALEEAIRRAAFEKALGLLRELETEQHLRFIRDAFAAVSKGGG
jgi:hypothetical protein